MSLRDRLRKLEARLTRNRERAQTRAAHRAHALERLERLGSKGDVRLSPSRNLLLSIAAMTDDGAAEAALAEYEAGAMTRARTRLRKLGAPLSPEHASTTRKPT